MRGIWVDTDFGFDDLWALLLLRHLGCEVAGVSLVAGNARLEQVAANAAAARKAYGFEWPVWQGASGPLIRTPETAERVLGPKGMQSRGRHLDASGRPTPPKGALEALSAWVRGNDNGPRQILALGPLTNLALLLRQMPDLPRRVARLVWMGGSTGRGNHTEYAEFNAVADAEALAAVAASGIRLDIVDLSFCREVTFGPDNMPNADPLTHDLLAGYLDIALSRGRAEMAIYDPLAALAIARPDAIAFQRCRVDVDVSATASYGATQMTPDPEANTGVATGDTAGLAQSCLRALERGACFGEGL